MSDHQCKAFKCRRQAVEMQAEIDRLRAEAHDNTGLLSLLYDIRAAAGDKEGRLMQSELVELIAGLRATSDRQAFLLQRFNVLASVAMDEGYTERSAAIRQCIDEIEDDGQPE